MSHDFGIFRSAADQILRELSTHHGNSPPSDPRDTDAIKEENARAFIRFEVALLRVFGVQDQLETHAATREKLAQDGQQPAEEDVIFAQIQQEVQDSNAQVGGRVC